MDEARQVFGSSGFSAAALEGYLTFFTTFRTFKSEGDRNRIYNELNFEPTSFETFAATFAGVKAGAA